MQTSVRIPWDPYTHKYVRIERVLDSKGRFSHAVIHTTGQKTKHVACLDACEYFDPNNLLRTKTNALSNVGFVVVGVVIAFYALSDFRSDIPKTWNVPAIACTVDGHLISLSLAAGTAYAGVASFLYHGTRTNGFASMDVASIYTVLLVYCSSRIFLIARALGAKYISGIASAAFFGTSVWLGNHIVRDIGVRVSGVQYGISALVGINAAYFCLGALFRAVSPAKASVLRIFNLLSRQSVAAYVCAICLFALAYFIRQRDSQNAPKSCNPDYTHTIWQMHAAWHLLCSAAPLCTYLAHRWELAPAICPASSEICDSDNVAIELV